ncbi:MAG: ABC transporter ATP-binding protein [bacterium]|nr:ABC transporter ATP-binding protein [bacterium]
MKNTRADSYSGISINKSAWRYYLKFYRGYYRPLLLSIAVSTVQSLIAIPIALLIKTVFDSLIPAGDFSDLTLAGAVLALLYLLNGAGTLWTRHVTLKTTKAVIQEFREEILKHLYLFSRAFYADADHGKLHTTVVQDTERLDVMTNALLFQMVPAFFISLVIGAILFYLNSLLFLVLIGSLPLLFLSGRTIGGKTRRKVYDFHRSFETFSKGIWFVLQKMNLTRIQSAEQLEMERQRIHIKDLRHTSAQMAWMQTAFISANNVTIALVAVIILIVGGRAVISGSMTLGGLISFYAVVAFVRPHLQMAFRSIPQIIEGNESLTTLHTLLETHHRRPYSGARQIEFSGKITLDTISFQYNDEPILRDISLSIDPGTTIAIFGPNGSGKTTIANLILGFYRPQKGELYADDYPFRELDIVHLRRAIGVVTQNSIIVTGTIWENITYGCPGATRQQVVQAAEMSQAHEFIQHLPQGYETFVGEDGVRLSGGESQRIAIARALLRRPRLLILDEPTNHLDAHAVRHLMDSLKTMDTDPTIIILSHDVDVIREAEDIYILQEGRIVSSGDYMMLSPLLNAVPGSRLDG